MRRLHDRIRYFSAAAAIYASACLFALPGATRGQTGPARREHKSKSGLAAGRWRSNKPSARPLASRGVGTAKRRVTPVIVLDPGHPSERNDGRRVVHGISEVRACWLVAVRLKRLLQAAGVEVVLTKQSENEFVANRRRALIANRASADLFLRLHCDSGEGTGFAVYYPDRQGRAHGRVGPSPAVINASRTAASRFHDTLALALAGKLKDNGLLGDSKTFVGRQQGALTGSVFSDVPALTVEMCVLDNRADATFISAREGREQMAQALLAACEATIR